MFAIILLLAASTGMRGDFADARRAPARHAHDRADIRQIRNDLKGRRRRNCLRAELPLFFSLIIPRVLKMYLSLLRLHAYRRGEAPERTCLVPY